MREHPIRCAPSTRGIIFVFSVNPQGRDVSIGENAPLVVKFFSFAPLNDSFTMKAKLALKMRVVLLVFFIVCKSEECVCVPASAHDK